MTRSICLATYNGSKFIALQLDSILRQIASDDEVIIVDDCSTDNTFEILQSYNDHRIRLYKNKTNLRHVKTFERAIGLAQGELIFLSDQDDIWEENRLSLFDDAFHKHKDIWLVTSNFSCIDSVGNTAEHQLRKVSAADSYRNTKNLLGIVAGKMGYYGCVMAFRRELKETILPFPAYVEAHDLWIAAAGNILRKNLHLDQSTLLHRLHRNNASDLKRGMLPKLKSRFGFIKSYFELKKRIHLNG